MNRFTTLITVTVLLAAPGPARALDWDALWLNRDQRAAHSMAQEDYSAAAETFRDPRWRAAARYRAGAYADAAEAWAGLDDTQAHYNRGNALARAGDLEAAMAAYETVLERQPGHIDARHNLELLRDLAKDPGESGSSGDREAGDDPDRSDDPSGGGQDAGESGAERGRAPDRPEDGAAKSDGSGGRDEQAVNEPATDAAGEPDRSPRRPEGDGNGARAAAGPEPDGTPEEQAAMDQWLRRIPDDPGGLLRRKLLYQYTSRDRGEEGVDPW